MYLHIVGGGKSFTKTVLVMQMQARGSLIRFRCSLCVVFSRVDDEGTMRFLLYVILVRKDQDVADNNFVKNV